MKKAIILCALLLLFGLVGCADNIPSGQEAPYETAGLTAVETGEPTPIETPLPERPILSQERELEIVESFREWAWPLFAGRSYVCEQELAHSLERGYLEYYFGTFNGREALGIFVPFGADLATMRENVAGYSFVFPDLGWYFVHSDSFDGRSDGGVHIWLHDDGDWMCFCVGYERGYLTAEDIGLIWALYENRAALWHYEDRAW